ncbi:MAG: GYD domain-containing protein [Bryobacteraceae bacterium]|jgi:uncharacterized protein with GYD domain
MLTYVTLMHSTRQGPESIDQAPERFGAAREKIHAQGGELVALYLTQGQYDLVAVSRWPGECTGMRFLSNPARQERPFGDVQRL